MLDAVDDATDANSAELKSAVVTALTVYAGDV